MSVPFPFPAGNSAVDRNLWLVLLHRLLHQSSCDIGCHGKPYALCEDLGYRGKRGSCARTGGRTLRAQSEKLGGYIGRNDCGVWCARKTRELVSSSAYNQRSSKPSAVHTDKEDNTCINRIVGVFGRSSIYLSAVIEHRYLRRQLAPMIRLIFGLANAIKQLHQARRAWSTAVPVVPQFSNNQSAAINMTT